MDFAKNLMEKYGWKEGEGLGKNLDGMSKPLKTTYKFDNAGLGIDPAAEFNNHWWERAYNDAANNININKNDGRVTVSVRNKDSVEISTKEYSLKKLSQKGQETGKYRNFLRSSKLTNVCAGTDLPNSIDLDDTKIPGIKQLTDEELFAACGGRTAHKGARHGLNLSGKLSRVEEQEKELLEKMKLRRTAEGALEWRNATSKKINKKKSKQTVVSQTSPPDYADDTARDKLDSLINTSDYYFSSRRQKKSQKKRDDFLSSKLKSAFATHSDDEMLSKLNESSCALKKTKNKKNRRLSLPDACTTENIYTVLETADDIIESAGSLTKKKSKKKNRKSNKLPASNDGNTELLNQKSVGLNSYRNLKNNPLDSDDELVQQEKVVSSKLLASTDDEDSDLVIKKLNEKGGGHIRKRKNLKASKKYRRTLAKNIELIRSSIENSVSFQGPDDDDEEL